MTRAEALAEARRRWGADAWVGVRWNSLSPMERYIVRNAKRLSAVTSGGTGPSWEAAFADADRRARPDVFPCNCPPDEHTDACPKEE